MARARAKSIRWVLVATALTLALGDLAVTTPAQAARQAGGDAIDRDPGIANPRFHLDAPGGEPIVTITNPTDGGRATADPATIGAGSSPT